MLNVIPRFIQDKLAMASEKRSGSFEASSLFVDIAGFTGITEKLMSNGRQGAEDLSVLINKVYRPLIETVHSHGGFIAVFAGDSITALFPDIPGNSALQAALLINEHFTKRKKYYLRHSHGQGIELRTGLASGKVSWVIFGEQQRAYLFYGDTVLRCSEAVKGKPPGSLVTHESFSAPPDLTAESEGSAISSRIKPSSALKFFPEQVLSSGKSGEFRNATSVFLALNYPPDSAELHSAVPEILHSTGMYGGFWNGMFYDDKGLHALVVFGAPVSYENNRKRAVDFAMKVAKCHGKSVKAGVSGGTVFAGTVGTSRRCTYTVLGDRVNQAARIMQATEWGKVLVSDDIAYAVRGNYRFERTSGSSSALFQVTGAATSPDEQFFTGRMLGREKQLKALLEFCKPIFNGQFGGMACVYGPAGIGKSRLLHELEKKLPSHSQTFVLQTDQVLRKGLNPFAQFLNRFFRQSGENSFRGVWAEFMGRLDSHPDREKAEPVAKELRRTRSLLGALAGFHERDALYQSLDSRGRFENTLFALKEFVKGLSLLAPTVIILEDTHWLDSDSEALLRNLTRNADGFPYLIIASSRPQDDGSLGEILSEEDVRRKSFLLKPLPENWEILVMKELLSGSPSEDLTAFILKRTQGNPFFMEQFCRYLTENSLLKRTGGRLRLADETVEIPEGINALIVARIDRLSRKLKELVQTASVLGREFDVRILSAILRGDSSRLYPLLHEGESETIWSAVNEVRYIFKHSILRDTVYRMQMQKRLKRLHLIAANAMEDFYGEDVSGCSEIAYHFERGSDFRKAALFLKRAAEFARDEYRNDEALDLYTRLLALCTNPKDEIETEIQIANILIDKGQRDEAQSMIQTNMERAEQEGSPDLAALCYRNMAKLNHRQGDNAEAVSFLNKALEIFRNQGNTWEIAGSMNVLGNINTVLGNYDEALQNFEESTKAAEAAGDRITQVLNISNVGNIHLYRYELDQAEEYYLRSIEECKAVNDRKALANALNNLAVVNYYRENFKECRRYLDEFVKISTEIGNKEGLAYIFGNLGILYQDLGEYDTAIEYHRKQIALARELGDRYNIAKATQQMGQLHKLKGEYSSAIECISRAAELCERVGDSRNTAQCIRDLGAVYLEIGEYDDASEQLHLAYELGKSGSDMEVCSSSRIYLAEISALKGDHTLAREYAEDAIIKRKEISERHGLPRTLVQAAEILIEIFCFERAGEILAEAEGLVGENSSDETAGRYRLARTMLGSREDPAGTADELLSLAAELSDHEELTADIYLRLYNLTMNCEYRREAAERYTRLHSKTPRMKYREKLSLLQNPQR